MNQMEQIEQGVRSGSAQPLQRVETSLQWNNFMKEHESPGAVGTTEYIAMRDSIRIFSHQMHSLRNGNDRENLRFQRSPYRFMLLHGLLRDLTGDSSFHVRWRLD
jgi:hypothetical protein